MLFFGVAKGLDTKLRKKTLRRSTLLPYVASTLSKCRPAAAEGAKLSTMRRGRVQPCLSEACQITYNAAQNKKKELN